MRRRRRRLGRQRDVERFEHFGRLEQGVVDRLQQLFVRERNVVER
jgi:hypothetical protein